VTFAGSFRARTLLAVFSATLALTTGLLLGEFAVRYRERHRTTVPGSTPLLFYRHSRLGHALVRNYDYFGWIHVNRQGFRGASVPLDKQPGTLRVMAVGGSTTFDDFVTRDEAAWPARLRFWLRELAPNRPVEVINAGTPGYRVIDDLIRLETDLYAYRPDVIVLYQAHNDLFAALQEASREPLETDRPFEVPAVTPWAQWLKRHSLLYGKVTERLQIANFRRRGRAVSLDRDAAHERSLRGLESGARQFERDVRLFLTVARTLGSRVVIPEVVEVSGVGVEEEPDSAIQRMWSSSVPSAPPEVVLAGYRRFNAVLHSLSVQFSVPFIPTESFGLKGTQFYADGDPIHFNDRGADRMGHAMAEALVASGALDVPNRPAAVR